jgi:hypothetical protein
MAAAALDVNEKSIRRSITIATKLSPDLIRDLSLTPLADNQRLLLALAELDTAMQRPVATHILAGETFDDALALAQGLRRRAAPAAWERLRSNLDTLPQRERDLFFHWYRSEMEVWLTAQGYRLTRPDGSTAAETVKPRKTSEPEPAEGALTERDLTERETGERETGERA